MLKSSRRIGVSIAGIAVVALALTGCSLPGSPVIATAPQLTGDTTLGQPDRFASVRGSRLCVVNNSTLPLSIFWRGYPNARDIPVGERNCNSGYETTTTDVSAEISYTPSAGVGEVHSLHVSATNGWLIGASAAATYKTPNGRKWGVCNLFSVGETESVDTGWLHGAMTRLNDSADNVEFEVTLNDKIGDPVGSSC